MGTPRCMASVRQNALWESSRCAVADSPKLTLCRALDQWDWRAGGTARPRMPACAAFIVIQSTSSNSTLGKLGRFVRPRHRSTSDPRDSPMHHTDVSASVGAFT